MKNTLIILLALSIPLINACDRPDCVNENEIFANYNPESKEYKDELAAQLNIVDQSQLTYWLQKYDEQNGKAFLYFFVQGDGLCALLHMSMNHWKRLEDVRRKKGVGRRGAEFTNLTFDIVKDAGHTEFVYKSFDRIID